MAPDQTGEIEVPGGHLYYERAGAGPPLVFVHAGIADHRQWDREFARFASTNSVVRYDLRGFGRSSAASAPFSHVADLETLLERLHALPATIVGASAGGRIALDLALEHPPTVRALLLAAPALSGYTDGMDPEARLTFEQDGARLADIEAAWRRGEHDVAIERLRIHWCPTLRGPAQELLRTMIRDNAEEVFTDATAAFDRGIQTGAATRLGAVRAKTRVLWGDHDVPTLGYFARRIARGVPEARLIPVRGADHLINLSRPEEFDAVLIDLLH